MGLFGKIFNGMMGKPEKTQAEIAFEKSVIKDGHKHAGMRVAQIINDKITSLLQISKSTLYFKVFGSLKKAH